MAVHPSPEEPGSSKEPGARRRSRAARRSGVADERRPRRAAPAGPPPPVRQRYWWQEILAVFVGYQIYDWTRGASPAHPGLAERNGRAIWRAEQWLHINPERALNHAVDKVPMLAALSGYYYLALNFTVPIGLMVWLYLCRPAQYGQLRWTLATLTAYSLVSFWFIPVSPPRFVVHGTIDTVATANLIGASFNNAVSAHANFYAAMPSLHVAWAGWCTLAAAMTIQRAWIRGIFWAYPVLTTLDIMVTANHFIADAIGGAIVLFAGWGTVILAPRLRRRAQRPQDPVSIRKQ